MQVVYEFIEYLENSTNLSFNTLRLYKRDLLDFTNFIKSTEDESFHIKSLSPRHLEAFANFIKNKGASTAAVNRKLTALHKMWIWLKETLLLNKDPFTQIVRDPQFRNKKATILSEHEVDLLLKREDNYDLTTELILELIYSCGLRVKELLGLTLEDISITEELIFINKDISAKSRIIPMIDSVKNLISEYIQTNNLKASQRLFQISAREVYRVIQAKALAVGIDKKISASVLRNSFIKHMKARGAHQIFLQDIMGQKNFARIA